MKKNIAMVTIFSLFATAAVAFSIIFNRETNKYPPALAAYQVHLDHAELDVERVVIRGDAILDKEAKSIGVVFSGIEEMGKNRGVVTHPVGSDNGKIYPMTSFWSVGHTKLSIKHPWLRNIYGPIYYGSMEVDGVKIKVLGAITDQMWYSVEE